MTTLSVDVPAHVSQLVFNIPSNQAIEELRQQLADAEARIATMAAELAVARERGNAGARASGRSEQDSPVVLAGSVRTLESEVLDKSTIQIRDMKSLEKYLKALKTKFGKLVTVNLKEETIWDDFPETGYSIKPIRCRAKKGQWTDCSRQKLLRPRYELFQSLGGKVSYLGTYAPSTVEEMTTEAFKELPFETRETVIGQSSHKKYRSELRSMYDAGEIVPRKIRFKRVGYDEQLARSLLALALEEEQGIGRLKAGEAEDVDSGSSSSENESARRAWWPHA